MDPPQKKARTDGHDAGPNGKDVEMLDVAVAVPGTAAKTGSDQVAAAANNSAPKAAEPPKELEEDAPQSSKPKLTGAVEFLVQDTTMNVLASTAGNLLRPLLDGGFQHLVAGARGSVGVKSGRYLFEVKIVEFLYPPVDFAAAGSRIPHPRNLLRVGFSTAGSSLFLGDVDGAVSFDSEGAFLAPKLRKMVSERFQRDSVLGVLLNLDESSPNYNTVSLFRDGKRMCPPQALPESFKGKELYPTVAFKSMTVHVNFGPQPLAPMPFKCRMLQDADQQDVVVTPAFPTPSGGKYEVLFPIGLPEEGPFDWLDLFLEKNPHYTELSDRSILKWLEQSNVWRPRGYLSRTAKDRPDFNFGIASIDDLSIRKMIQVIAPLQNRNYVVMEVRGNLTKESRVESLAQLWNPDFQKIAVVIIGEPTADFKSNTYNFLLKQKQEVSDITFRASQARAKQKRLETKRQMEIEKARKQAEKEQKRREAELKKKQEEERKAAEKLAAAKKAELLAQKKAADEAALKALAESRTGEATATQEIAVADVETYAKATAASFCRGQEAVSEVILKFFEEQVKNATEEESVKSNFEPFEFKTTVPEGVLAEKVTVEISAQKKEDKFEVVLKSACSATAEAQKDEEVAAEEKAEEAEDNAEEKQEEIQPEEEEEEEMKDPEIDEMDVEPPTVELSDEEKQVWFKKATTPDVAPVILAGTFARFSLPEKGEGFDEVRYEWSKADKCKEYFRKWMLEKKLTTRVEDLKPSPWFLQHAMKWQKAVQEWQAKQTSYKAAMARKAADKKIKEMKKAQEKREKEAKEAEEKRKAEEARLAEEKRKAEESKNIEENHKAEEPKDGEEKQAEEPKDGEEKQAEEPKDAEEKQAEEPKDAEEKQAEEPKDAEEKQAEEPKDAEEKQAEEPKDAEEKQAEEPKDAEEKQAEEVDKKPLDREVHDGDAGANGVAKPMEVDGQEEAAKQAPEELEDGEEAKVNFDDVDVFAVEDVLNVGANMPLFRDFEAEDWALLTLRFELHLLVQAFRRDVNDPERQGIFLDHLPFYYNKYFKKTLSPRYYGVEDVPQLLKLLGDTIYFQQPKVIDSQLWEEVECMGVFVKLTEEARRERTVKLDLGDTAAKITLQPAPGAPPYGDKGYGKRSFPDYGKPYKGDGKYHKGYGKGDSKNWHSSLPVPPAPTRPPVPPPPPFAGAKGDSKGADKGFYKGGGYKGDEKGGGFKGDGKGGFKTKGPFQKGAPFQGYKGSKGFQGKGGEWYQGKSFKGGGK